jgi:hypothetical protein
MIEPFNGKKDNSSMTYNDWKTFLSEIINHDHLDDSSTAFARLGSRWIYVDLNKFTVNNKQLIIFIFLSSPNIRFSNF